MLSSTLSIELIPMIGIASLAITYAVEILATETPLSLASSSTRLTISTSCGCRSRNAFERSIRQYSEEHSARSEACTEYHAGLEAMESERCCASRSRYSNHAHPLCTTSCSRIACGQTGTSNACRHTPASRQTELVTSKRYQCT